jgi:hypothetical protein
VSTKAGIVGISALATGFLTDRHGMAGIPCRKKLLKPQMAGLAVSFGLPFVQVLECGNRGIVEKLHFTLLFQLTQPLADGGTLVRRQPGQLSDDFLNAHGNNLPPSGDTGKSGGTTPVEHNAGNQHLVADFQCPNFFFGELSKSDFGWLGNSIGLKARKIVAQGKASR